MFRDKCPNKLEAQNVLDLDQDPVVMEKKNNL